MRVGDIIQSFFISLVLVFLLFGLFWSMIFSTYMKHYGIYEFFNPFFGYVFDVKAFFILVVIFGIGFILPFLNKVFKFLYVLMLGCVVALAIPPFGRIAGDIMLAKEHIVVIDGKEQKIYGLYENRHHIVYLSEDSDDFETRKRNLVYYQKSVTEE